MLESRTFLRYWAPEPVVASSVIDPSAIKASIPSCGQSVAHKCHFGCSADAVRNALLDGSNEFHPHVMTDIKSCTEIGGRSSILSYL